MVQGVLSISNVINVSLTAIPSGLTERNVNTLALFTTESPSNSDAFRRHVSPRTVTNDYGTSSVTAAMANAIFAQTPNLRTGRGELIVVPMTGTSATVGTLVTADISGNLAAFQGVTDGEFAITIDGTSQDVTGLDFTSATSFADIATTINNAIANSIVTWSDTTFMRFESKTVGDDSDITIAAVSGGSGTDLTPSGFLNVSGATITSGVDATGETLLQAITRVQDSVFFAGVITNLEMEDDVVVSTASAIQAQDRLFVHQFSSTAQIGGVITTIRAATNTKTRCLFYSESRASANLFKAAYAGRGFSVNFEGADTAQTLNLKPLATIQPDSGLNQTLFAQAATAGADLYVSFDGVSSIVSNGANDYFDNIYSDIQLKFALEAAGFNFLRQTNTKVPQTEQGMNGLKAAYAGVMERFVNAGFFAPGTWNSSETFGDPEIFKQNITNRGYYVFSLPISQQSQSSRENREAPVVQIAGKRAGAIHSSDVIVVIED